MFTLENVSRDTYAYITAIAVVWPSVTYHVRTFPVPDLLCHVTRGRCTTLGTRTKHLRSSSVRGTFERSSSLSFLNQQWTLFVLVETIRPSVCVFVCNDDGGSGGGTRTCQPNFEPC